VLLPNSFESALAARRWGARIRLGYDTDMRHALLTHMIDLPSPRRHQVDEYTGLLEAADIPAKTERPQWRLGEDPVAEAEVTTMLTEAGCGGAGSLIGLHLGAAFGSSKLWPPASYAELIGQLTERGCEPLLIGGPEDLAMAEAVQALAGRPGGVDGGPRPGAHAAEAPRPTGLPGQQRHGRRASRGRPRRAHHHPLRAGQIPI
jgi:heptosyltransferase-2